VGAARAAVGTRDGLLTLLAVLHGVRAKVLDAGEDAAAVAALDASNALDDVLGDELATRGLDDLDGVPLGAVGGLLVERDTDVLDHLRKS
jgi:hypothetical protein